MVDKAYMLHKPPGPGPAKRYLDQVMLPVAIDLAGSGEVAIQRLSERSGIRPAVILGGLAGGAILLAALALGRQDRRGRRGGGRRGTWA